MINHVVRSRIETHYPLTWSSAPSMSRMSQCTVGGGRDTASSSVYSGTHCSSSELAVACRHTL